MQPYKPTVKLQSIDDAKRTFILASNGLLLWAGVNVFFVIISFSIGGLIELIILATLGLVIRFINNRFTAIISFVYTVGMFLSSLMVMNLMFIFIVGILMVACFRAIKGSFYLIKHESKN